MPKSGSSCLPLTVASSRPVLHIRSYHKVSVSHAWIKDIGEGRRVRPDNRNMVAGASVEARAEAQNDNGNR